MGSERKRVVAFAELRGWSCRPCEGVLLPRSPRAGVGSVPAAFLILGLRKFKWKYFGLEFFFKKKREQETSGEKNDARLYTWVEVKGKARDLVAKKQVKGVDGPCYHDFAITESTWENQQVMLKTTYSEKWWQIHLFATWIKLLKVNKGGCWEKVCATGKPWENANSGFACQRACS